MKDLDLKKNSLSLYFVVAYTLPIVTTIIVALVAGAPSTIVVNEMSAAALMVLMGMVHAPTIEEVQPPEGRAAARHTDDRQDNFDIYLPARLARASRSIQPCR